MRKLNPKLNHPVVSRRAHKAIDDITVIIRARMTGSFTTGSRVDNRGGTRCSSVMGSKRESDG